MAAEILGYIHPLAMVYGSLDAFLLARIAGLPLIVHHNQDHRNVVLRRVSSQPG
jgi:hypothetical protein